MREGEAMTLEVKTVNAGSADRRKAKFEEGEMVYDDFLQIRERASRLFFLFGDPAGESGGLGEGLKELSEQAELVLESEKMSANDPHFMKTLEQLASAARRVLRDIRGESLPEPMSSEIAEVANSILKLSNDLLPEKKTG